MKLTVRPNEFGKEAILRVEPENVRDVYELGRIPLEHTAGVTWGGNKQIDDFHVDLFIDNVMNKLLYNKWKDEE